MAEDEELLSEGNKTRCIEEFSKLKPLRVAKSPKSLAAVLIPIVLEEKVKQEESCQVGLLYTKRTAHLSSHAREVCFPGGKVDPNETPIQAALRESFEEIGLDQNNVDIWTCLPPISNHTGSTAVVPVVGQVKNFNKSQLILSQDEVFDVFVKGVYELHQPQVAGYTQFRVANSAGYSLPVYNCAPYPIWGLSAIITYQFLSIFLKGRTKGFNHRLKFQTPMFNFSKKTSKNTS